MNSSVTKSSSVLCFCTVDNYVADTDKVDKFL